MSKCKHWQDCGVTGGGCCGIGAYTRPSNGVCFQCPKYDGPARGFGDTVAKVVKAVTLGTVKPCGGCLQRQAQFNEKVRYKVNNGP